MTNEELKKKIQEVELEKVRLKKKLAIISQNYGHNRAAHYLEQKIKELEEE